MSVIFFLIPLSILVAAGFLGAFIWAVRSGQYEDTCTPSMRLLVEERVGTESTDRRRPGPSGPIPPSAEGARGATGRQPDDRACETGAALSPAVDPPLTPAPCPMTLAPDP